METYVQQQSESQYFSGHYRQRGSCFVALAVGIGRAALAIARKFLWPVAKNIGRELMIQAAPELVDVYTNKKSPKQAIKKTVEKNREKTSGRIKNRKNA